MKFDLYHHHHRLQYLFLSKKFQNIINHVGKSPIDKVLVLNNLTHTIVIEYTDGVIEKQLCESTFFAKNVIDTIEKSIDTKGKKKIYFRPLYSDNLSQSLKLMLDDHGWDLCSLFPWSYYAGNYIAFYEKRKDIRNFVFSNNRKNLTFFGRTSDIIYPKIDRNLGTDYPVKRSEIKEIIDEDDIIKHPSRIKRLENFSKSNNVNINVVSNSSEGLQSLNHICNSRLLIQPHGVSVRHNIYEGMMLGIPSIIERTSYNIELFGLFQQINFDENEKIEIIDNVENQNTLINFFETKMTPDAIIDLLIKKVLHD
jgi:hypothetical protein